MLTNPEHLFSVDGDTLVPTELVRGPWDHGFQHGGAVAGALGWAAATGLGETVGSERFMLSRQTTEIIRPAPALPLRYSFSVDHEGRRSRVISSSLWHGDRCVARASTQWSRRRDGPDTEARCDPAVPIRPTMRNDPGQSEFDYPRPGFNCDVFELRPVYGTTEDPGPGLCWVRMRKSLIEGHPVDPIQFLTTLADLGNAVGWDVSPTGEPMVNADLTLQLLRYPKGEWVCLESSSLVNGSGVGMMETTLWDGDGRIGRVLSTMMESPMPLAADPAANKR